MPDPLQVTESDIREFQQDSMDISIELHPDGWQEPQPFGIPTDLSYQTYYVPFDSIPPLHVSENQILKDVIRHTQEPGIGNHHPAVAQVVVQSLEEYPELQHAYLQS